MSTPHVAEDLGKLRAEHDALAARIAARSSIDVARKAIYTGFAGMLAAGLAVKLAFDRWFSTRLTAFKGPPMFFFIALGVASVLLVTAAVWAAQARRRMREEDALFARLLELRARLGLDA